MWVVLCQLRFYKSKRKSGTHMKLLHQVPRCFIYHYFFRNSIRL
uniref:Uncharacterized protein n=1 Tax=Amphimedon queenslandica TaxID=400682 RepID=A0A1X7UKW2_AMPQE